MLGLPEGARALLFDLDGVLTQTAVVHTAAWKTMFDDFLEARGEPEFTDDDYLQYVDGKPRPDGITSFLLSRGIALPVGSPSDPTSADTVTGLGARKNELVLQIIDRDGVNAYQDAVDYLDAAAETDLKLAVVSSSANAKRVLAAAGIADRFSLVVDGVVIAREGLRGKPAPDCFLLAASDLGATAAEAVVFEDALSGVQAGRDGDFGTVVGVNRVDAANGKALKDAGATVVVQSLTDLLEP
jgi:beta-phosphoglucomutase family hydrolase